jgi:hypothetical protein
VVAPSEGSGCPYSRTAATPDPSHITSPPPGWCTACYTAGEFIPAAEQPVGTVCSFHAGKDLSASQPAGLPAASAATGPPRGADSRPPGRPPEPTTVGLPATPSDLCVTCLVRVGWPRPTVLRAVVCGPCWAAHGGSPAAGDIGPVPTVTVASADPRNQWHWLSALRRQDWVQQIRADGQANLLTVARLVALYAGWETLESRPTWARLLARSGLSERTVARWLQELRVRGWLAHLERGSTPAHRPMALAHQLVGNRAAVYGLRIPLTPEEALHRAVDQLVARLADDLTCQATAEATQALPLCSASAPPGAHTNTDPADAAPLSVHVSFPGPIVDSTRPNRSDQKKDHLQSAGDTNGSPSWSGLSKKQSWVGGFSRASTPVDNSTQDLPNPGKTQPIALRASLDNRSGPNWAITVPTSRFAMLVAADWLRCRLSVFALCSRKLIRHLCKPYWRAGWCNRDIVHAMDHRPSVFGQPAGVLICPQRIVAPKAFIASRLAAWRNTDGAILPGHWSSRVADAAAIKAARAQVRARYGRAGAALLRPGERTLTTHHITEHGRTARPPASPTTRAAAKATVAATLDSKPMRSTVTTGPRNYFTR